MRQPVRDLFGQVPISHDDIAAWLVAVPRMDPASPRAARYVVAYSVTDKIATAKLNGTFEATVQSREQPAHWWQRFKWS